VGGKSTLQNEIVGDLQAEFSVVPERAEELSLEDLGASLSPAGYNGAPGKVIGGHISRIISSKMPGGFTASSIKTYLKDHWGLGVHRTDGVMIMMITEEPPARLSSENDAKSWLDGVVQIYAETLGIQLSNASTNSSGGGAAVVTINSEDFIKFQKEHEDFVEEQIQVMFRHLRRDPREPYAIAEELRMNNLKLEQLLDQQRSEHGEVYMDGIKPIFSAKKARNFDSWWNWVRQDSIKMYYDIIFNKLTTVDRDITDKCISLMNRTTTDSLETMSIYIDRTVVEKGQSYALAKQLATTLLQNCQGVLNEVPRYKDVMYPTGPKTVITQKGDIQYSEVARQVRK